MEMKIENPVKVDKLPATIKEMRTNLDIPTI